MVCNSTRNNVKMTWFFPIVEVWQARSVTKKETEKHGNGQVGRQAKRDAVIFEWEIWLFLRVKTEKSSIYIISNGTLRDCIWCKKKNAWKKKMRDPFLPSLGGKLNTNQTFDKIILCGLGSVMVSMDGCKIKGRWFESRERPWFFQVTLNWNLTMSPRFVFDFFCCDIVFWE